MENLSAPIEELKNIRDLKSKLSERESELATPVLSEITLISDLYSLFKTLCTEKNKVLYRRKFLFIILRLFAPSSLVGTKLPNGLRAELAKLFSETTPYVLSNDIRNILFFYQHYEEFRNDVNKNYAKIKEMFIL